LNIFHRVGAIFSVGPCGVPFVEMFWEFRL
jgi:hypothetical protein